MTATLTTDRRRVSVALVALMTGTMLAPLNSSMVAVALHPVQQDFGVSLAEATWVVTIFYLTACVAQPAMGRLAALVGPRALFTAGMALATVAAAAAPFAPDLGVLVLCRALLAVGISTSFPCAIVLVRRHGGADHLTRVATVNTTAGAVGPVLGGLLVSWGGWPALFWVNLPVTLLALGVAAATLPGRDPRPDPSGTDPATGRRGVDVLGLLLFAGGVTALLLAMLALPRVDLAAWGAAAVLLLGFVAWERRARSPFVDVRGLWASPGLTGVLGTFVLFNLAYYGAFYGLPQWFQGTLGTTADVAGLLILPIAATSVVATVTGAPLMRRIGVERTVVVAGVLLLLGLLAVVAFDRGTPYWWIVVVGVVLGVPYGLGNLGMQRLMYDRAPDELAGVVGGLFQSARYVGAILAVGLTGATAPRVAGAPADLTVLAWCMSGVAVVVLVLVVADQVRADRRRADAGAGPVVRSDAPQPGGPHA